jgi:hypothetical protein
MVHETIEEFLARGGKIDKVDLTGEPKQKTIGSVTKKTTTIMTLAEGELYFAEKGKRNKKVKEPDYSGINFDLIPPHLRSLLAPAENKIDKTGDSDQAVDGL